MSEVNLKAQSLMERGAHEHGSGQLDKAEKLYKRALELDGMHSDSLHLLGLLYHQKGQHEPAVKLIRQAIAIKPQDPNYNTNLAIVLNALSRWSEAEEICVFTINNAPEHAEAYNNLGRALAAQEKYIQAKAAYTKAFEYAPNNASAKNNLGYLYMGQGLYDLAESAFLDAIKIDATFLLAYSNLASTYLAMNSLDRAEQVCRMALVKDPQFIPIIQSLGVTSIRLKKNEDAERLFKQVLELDPLHSQAALNLASLYSFQGKIELAKVLFEDIIKQEPDNSNAFLNIGVFHSELGNSNDAIFYLEKAIEINPNNIEAYYVLSTSGKVTFDLETLNKLEVKIDSDKEITPDQRTKLHFVIAIHMERLGETERAFNFYTSGNRCRNQLLQKSGSEFDPVEHYEDMQNYKNIFNDGFFKRWNILNREIFAESPSPIFIIGMPRSGTTLLEQIISTHSEIVTGGELSIVGSFVNDFIAKTGGKDKFPVSTKYLDFSLIEKWSKNYLARIQELTSGETYVIDKTPFNYNHLWLIKLMYPNARVIHCRRDARDVGLSCFQQNFTQGYPWSCNLEHIGHYINAYRDLTKFWQEILDIPMLEVVYEDFILDLEVNSRSIIEFIGLEWQKDILEFHRNKSNVRTASKWQVREPIYNHSVGRWRKYEKQLKPLIDALEAF